MQVEESTKDGVQAFTGTRDQTFRTGIEGIERTLEGRSQVQKGVRRYKLTLVVPTIFREGEDNLCHRIGQAALTQRRELPNQRRHRQVDVIGGHLERLHVEREPYQLERRAARTGVA